MLDVSGLMGSSGDGAAAGDGGASGGSSEVGASSSIPGVEESERISGGGGGGNRWPRQETLSLLKIRSEMDVAFRDSSLKGPLWEEVSRKMAELGFQRSAKKCKEKFENVYKYHKRTKDGRAAKPDGKTYRFFDQLQALESSPALPRPQPSAAAAMVAPPMQTINVAGFPLPPHVGSSSTVPSISPSPLSVLPPNANIQSTAMNNSPFQASTQQPQMNTSNLPQSHHLFHGSNPNLMAGLLSNSSSSSTSSDEDIHRRRGRKRKWNDFFEKLKAELLHKQEELQKRFLDTLEKRERDRMAREEAWRAQETARMNREHELLLQERSIAAAKDAAVIAFLQKITAQPNLQIPVCTTAAPPPPQVVKPPDNNPPRQPPPPPPPHVQPNTLSAPPPPVPVSLPMVSVTPTKMLNTSKTDNGGDKSSSRWPKAEIEALIKLRTNLDLKYQENGPKGPLWEEISAGMGKIGYNRSAKRCKEKWENINKYYKKVKESSKKRPEDSKTCPYFHQLEALYKDRTKPEISPFNPEYSMKADNPMVPIMARPVQQWPLPDQQHQDSAMHDLDHESDINDEDDDGDEEDEEDGGSYEVVPSNQPSSMTNTVEH